MFEHRYEKEIASEIINNYNRKRLACDHDKKSYHAIGILFRLLLKQLNINLYIIYKGNSIQLITKSNLLDFDNSDEIQDLSPKITEGLNLHELRIVKFLQTISFLKNLEEQNYIIVLNCEDKPEITKPEVYESYEITDPDLVVFINRLRGSRIIPTTALIEISAYDFETVEKRQYDKQVQLSEEAISEARKANEISQKSVEIAEHSLIQSKHSSRLSNQIAIGVALLAMFVTVVIGLLPTSITTSSIHEIGREIYLNHPKTSSKPIIINTFQEIDSTKYGKVENEDS